MLLLVLVLLLLKVVFMLVVQLLWMFSKDNLRSELLWIFDTFSIGCGRRSEQRVTAASTNPNSYTNACTTAQGHAGVLCVLCLISASCYTSCCRRLIWFLIQLIEPLTSTRKVPRVLCTQMGEL